MGPDKDGKEAVAKDYGCSLAPKSIRGQRVTNLARRWNTNPFTCERDGLMKPPRPPEPKVSSSIRPALIDTMREPRSMTAFGHNGHGAVILNQYVAMPLEDEAKRALGPLLARLRGQDTGVLPITDAPASAGAAPPAPHRSDRSERTEEKTFEEADDHPYMVCPLRGQ